MEHKLKTLPPYWDAVNAGLKNFEVRRDDRGFQKGDVVILEKHDGYRFEMDGAGFSAKPKSIRKVISYVLTGGQFGIDPGYVILGLQPADTGDGRG